METGNFSGLQNGNWKFYGFHSIKRKFFRFTSHKFPVSIYTRIIPEFRFTQQISGSFHFQNGIFFRKNGNPSRNLSSLSIIKKDPQLLHTLHRGLLQEPIKKNISYNIRKNDLL